MCANNNLPKKFYPSDDQIYDFLHNYQALDIFYYCYKWKLDDKFLDISVEKGLFNDKSPEEQLFMSAQVGSVKYIEDALKKGANINKENNKYETPVFITISNNHLDAVKCLVKHGANLNVFNNDNLSPFDFALKYKCLDICDFLKDKSFKIDVLLSSCKRGYIQYVEYAIKRGADINYIDPDRVTPLILAVINNKFDVVKYLVDHGVDVEYRGRNKYSALDRAISKDNFEIIEYLLDNHYYSKEDLKKALRIAESGFSGSIVNLLKEKLKG